MRMINKSGTRKGAALSSTLTLHGSRRLRKCSLNIPVVFESRVNRYEIDVKVSRKIRQTSRDATNSEVSVLSSVSGLLFRSCPDYVSGFIPTIVINSFERHPLRTRPHVCVKVCEIHPSFAHGNPPSSVIRESLTVTFGAASNHALPKSVRTCSCHVMGDSGIPDFFQQATARKDGSPNVAASDFLNCPAIAPDNAPASPVSSRRVGNYSNPSISLTDVGFSSRHNDGNGIVVLAAGASASTERPLRLSHSTPQLQ